MDLHIFGPLRGAAMDLGYGTHPENAMRWNVTELPGEQARGRRLADAEARESIL